MERKETFRIFIGYDSGEERAFTVCSKSILRRASLPVQIYPLRQDWLRSLGIYWRARENLASTEFTYTRWLVPALAGYHGPALFVDADFVFLADVAELFALHNPRYAVQVVQHDYTPTETTKMGGIVQTVYPRKNWSSLILFTTGHHMVQERLTPYEVNTRTGAYLHRFEWLSDEWIGALPQAWNVLSDYTQCDAPKAVHLTGGIGAIHGGTHQYDEVWNEEERA